MIGSHCHSSVLNDIIKAFQPDTHNSHVEHGITEWLLDLDRATMHRALFYVGYTESSYLRLAWEDYCRNKTEFILQWSDILLEYFTYCRGETSLQGV